MGTPREARAVRPVAGLLASSPLLLAEARAALVAAFGPLDVFSPPYPWLESAYYRREMGERIWRQWVAFAATMHPGELPERKLAASALEDRWRGPHGRAVNIDPGYLDLDKLVLASTKNAAHRLWLGRGIYGEATLRYASGAFQPWPYTYRDYAWPAARAFFSLVRARWRQRARPAPRR